MKARIEPILQVVLTALLAVVAAYLGAGYLRGAPLIPGIRIASTTPVEASAPAAEPGQVAAKGKVVPQASANLALPSGGVLIELLVAEGDDVTAGQVIARLSTSEQEARVAAAEAELRRVRAQLDDLKAGASPAEIKVAQAAVDLAQVAATSVADGPLPEDVAIAEAALAAARASYQKAQQGPDPTELIAAKAELANAAAALQLAQANYDRVRGAADIATMSQSLDLERATNSYTAVQSRYDLLAKGANSADIAKAQADVARAVAELNRAKATPSPARKAEAEAQVRFTQAQLELKQSPARPQAVAAAEASVAIAEATLAQTKAQLAAVELRAPFDGTVAAVLVRPGEYVGQGAPVVQLGDLSRWQIETTDLTEVDVSRVHLGDRAAVKVDALPDLSLEGTVTGVKALGQSLESGTIYTVYVDLDQPDGRLSWNMTSLVTFDSR